MAADLFEETKKIMQMEHQQKMENMIRLMEVESLTRSRLMVQESQTRSRLMEEESQTKTRLMEEEHNIKMLMLKDGWTPK